MPQYIFDIKKHMQTLIFSPTFSESNVVLLFALLITGCTPTSRSVLHFYLKKKTTYQKKAVEWSILPLELKLSFS